MDENKTTPNGTTDETKAKIGQKNNHKKPSIEVEAKSKAAVKENTFLQKALRQVLLAVLFLVIGAGLVFFLVYRPAAKELSLLQDEVDRLQSIEAQYSELLQDYNNLTVRHEVAVTLVNVYQIQNNVNIARIALLDGNETRLSIALGYVEADIKTLDIGDFPEKIDLSTRVDTIKEALPDDTQKALAELSALFDDLLLLANNLEITE